MKINVKTSQSNYDIIIENGAFNALADSCGDLLNGKKVFAVTDDNVDSFYGKKLDSLLSGYEYKKVVLPHGETTKCTEYLNKLYSEMAGFKMSRSDIVVCSLIVRCCAVIYPF